MDDLERRNYDDIFRNEEIIEDDYSLDSSVVEGENDIPGTSSSTVKLKSKPSFFLNAAPPNYFHPVISVNNLPPPKGLFSKTSRRICFVFEKQRVTAEIQSTKPSFQVEEEVSFDVTHANSTIYFEIVEEWKEREVIARGEVSLSHLVGLFHKQIYEHKCPLLVVGRRENDNIGKVSKQASVIFSFTTAVAKANVKLDSFVYHKVLGKGSFGKVILVVKKDTKRLYAMKVLNKRHLLDRNEVKHTHSEFNILRYINHPYIVGLKYSFQSNTRLFLVMDFLGGGELFYHLKNEGSFSEERSRLYIAEVILALEHLHKNGILYRDLKPENILLDLSGHACLTDFGLCKENLDGVETTDTFCGTSEYLAPEVLKRTGHGKSVDWWSLGTLLYEMLSGYPPFYSENTREMFENILFGKLRFEDHISIQARALLEGLLKRTPNDRYGGTLSDAEEIKSHPFFSSLDWRKVEKRKAHPIFVPKTSGPVDVSHFDKEFTDEDPIALLESSYLGQYPNSELSRKEQEKFKGFSFVNMREYLGDPDRRSSSGSSEGLLVGSVESEKKLSPSPQVVERAILTEYESKREFGYAEPPVNEQEQITFDIFNSGEVFLFVEPETDPTDFKTKPKGRSGSVVKEISLE